MGDIQGLYRDIIPMMENQMHNIETEMETVFVGLYKDHKASNNYQ